jgi:hypothetical protein
MWIHHRKIRIAELQAVLPVYDFVIAKLQAKQDMIFRKKQKLCIEKRNRF